MVQLASTTYSGANHTHLTELLRDREGIDLSRPTVRRIWRGGHLGPAPPASPQAPGAKATDAPDWYAGADRRQFPPVAGR